MKAKRQVLEQDIATYTRDGVEYICITNIARYKNPNRTGVIIEFLGIWEQLNNQDFKAIEFDDFKKQAGLNSFTQTPERWIEQTSAIEATQPALVGSGD